jgi:hypothetical protein
MGFKPASSVLKPKDYKRCIDGIVIKPTLFVSKSGKQMMAGSIDGEIIVDKDGKVLPLHHVKHNGIL